MTKQEAILEMQNSELITHLYFSTDEWMTMRENMIVLEDGVECSQEEFWLYRSSEIWDDGYSFFEDSCEVCNGDREIIIGDQSQECSACKKEADPDAKYDSKIDK